MNASGAEDGYLDERARRDHDAHAQSFTAPAGRSCLVAAALLDHVPGGGRPLLLGPWCTQGAPPSIDVETVPAYGGGTPPPPASLDETFDDVVRCAALALDDFHGTELGFNYWSVLAGQFLSSLIPVVDDLHRRLQAASDLAGATAIHGHLPAMVPTSNRAALSALYFDASIVGQLASGLASSSGVSATVHLHPLHLQPPEIRRPQPSLKTRVARASRSFASRAANRRRGTHGWGAWIVGVTSLQELRAMSRLREPTLVIPAGNVPLPATPWMPWEPTSRGRLGTAFASTAARAGDELAQRVLNVAHLVLPWRFVEGWRFDRDHATLRAVAQRRVIVSTFPSEHNLALFATARTLGARLAFYQHGGHYGEGPMGWAERYERRIGDGFFSWGWADGDAIPAPSARLARFAKDYRSASRRRAPEAAGAPSKYFINFTADEPHGFGLGSSTAVERYGSIHDVLDPMLRACAQVVVRRHPKSAGSNDDDTVLPEGVAREDPSVATPQSIANSSLVVLDLFRSTTFLECLVVSHPVAIFLAAVPAARDPEHAAMIQALREARVINVGPEEMRTFWHGVYPDLQRWWSSERVQFAIGAYRERFASTQTEWVAPFTETVQSWFDGLGPT